MKFIQRYKKPEYIGVSDNVRYRGKDYQVLINISIEIKIVRFIPTENFTILINNNGKRIIIFILNLKSYERKK